ncbi:unnamed protein product [Haemonchus placei]|uniref:PDZ domain-containing protein n=1 Tax=Haemonchus placei TaxID=6290 RepID=A0A0N4WS01_HAEPC|nr:unnamed protein product [Haemonchus placei]
MEVIGKFKDEMDRELHTIEERWMERTRNTMQERDTLLQKLQQLEEQVDSLRADLNRAVAYRLEVEESRNRMKNQLESVQRDYEETMAERSSVLEENTRMGEERDRLKQTVHALSRTLNELRGRTTNCFRRLDHILMVNDIDVMEMDQRSVIDILKNSHHLKMLIRRRANASNIGIELGNGVFVNAVNAGGLASRVGVEPGHRIVHVNNVPVYDAKHAEQLIRCKLIPFLAVPHKFLYKKKILGGSGQVVVGLLDGKKRPDPYAKDQSKQKVTLFSKIFGRQSVDKPRVVAKANIGNTSGEPAFLRQGSLRIPSQQHVSPELVRYGSLRAPQGSAEHAKIVEQLDHFLNKNHSLRSSVICEATGSTWPKSMQMVEEQAAAVPPRRRLHRPSVFPKSRRPDAVVHRRHQHGHLVLPETPPSGTLLSETSDRVRRVCLSKEGNEFGLGLENSNGGVVISNVPGRANGLVRRGDRLLDVGGINMRSADKDAASKVLTQFCVSQDESVRLCGGNAMGILSEAAAGELQEGDLILEIDGYNVRGATLEEATEALLESLSEMAELHVEDGGDRLNRLRLGADGDSFYVRINVDRNSENKDELDIKAGEIVFVDNTMFMGQRGKWRAWKVDREGRQRENGIIPSATHMERSDMRGKKAKVLHSSHHRQTIPTIFFSLQNRISLTRPICERVERVSSSKRRPIVLFGPLLTPFIQLLLDDSSKFSHCVPECRALQSMEVDRLLASCELIEARRRETLYDVITAPAIQHFAEMGIHCIVDVSPSGIQRLHSLRIYPIVIRIKFKSAKQIKDVKEDCCGEKITTKQAKDLIDRVRVFLIFGKNLHLEVVRPGGVVVGGEVAQAHSPRIGSRVHVS